MRVYFQIVQPHGVSSFGVVMSGAQKVIVTIIQQTRTIAPIMLCRLILRRPGMRTTHALVNFSICQTPPEQAVCLLPARPICQAPHAPAKPDMCRTRLGWAVFFPPALPMQTAHRPMRLVPAMPGINSMLLEQAVFQPAQLIRSQTRLFRRVTNAQIPSKRVPDRMSTTFAHRSIPR